MFGSAWTAGSLDRLPGLTGETRSTSRVERVMVGLSGILLGERTGAGEHDPTLSFMAYLLCQG